MDLTTEYPEGLEPIVTDMFGEGGAEEVREYYLEDWEGWNEGAANEFNKYKELEEFCEWFGFDKGK